MCQKYPKINIEKQTNRDFHEIYDFVAISFAFCVISIGIDNVCEILVKVKYGCSTLKQKPEEKLHFSKKNKTINNEPRVDNNIFS